MRKYLVIAVFLVGTLAAKAQIKKTADEVPKSNIETFSVQSGSFSKKEITLIGKAGKVEIEIIKITDVLTGKVVSGIKLSGYSGGTYSSEKSAFLDADEIEAFLKVVQYVTTKVFDSTVPENSVEYNYYARGGFSGGAYNSKKEWSGYVKLEKYDSNSYFFLNKETFTELGNLITTAKSKL